MRSMYQVGMFIGNIVIKIFIKKESGKPDRGCKKVTDIEIPGHKLLH